MTRKVILTTLALCVLLTVTVVGFVAVRNMTPDKLLPFLMDRGMALSKQQADKLERDVEADPGNFADRIELLNFYSFKRVSSELNPEEMANRRKHILWVIANKSSSAFAGDPAMQFYRKSEESDTEGLEEAQKLWLVQVGMRSSDSRTLYNAGEFFSSVNEYPQSEEFLERARAIDPLTYDISFSLATDYWHDARYSATSDQRRNLAVKALGVFEQAMKDAHNKEEMRFVLSYAAQAAFEAGEEAKAAAWSEEMLSMAETPEEGRDYADEIHYGNTVLGRIALQHGDVDGAAAHLVRAAAIMGNPHLDTFGPNMMLAKELLEKGDSKPVLTYFQSCGKFWKSDDGKLAKWRSDVIAGKTPDFGPNLNY
jgi:tetratricopeptide (TPR) repeat protein